MRAVGMVLQLAQRKKKGRVASPLFNMYVALSLKFTQLTTNKKSPSLKIYGIWITWSSFKKKESEMLGDGVGAK